MLNYLLKLFRPTADEVLVKFRATLSAAMQRHSQASAAHDEAANQHAREAFEHAKAADKADSILSSLPRN